MSSTLLTNNQQINELRQILIYMSLNQKLISPLVHMIQGYAKPFSLQVHSKDELQREIDIWLNVMYNNMDEKGNMLLKTHQEIKRAQDRLIKRVGHISDWDVSKVTNMDNLWFGDEFKDDISRWDVWNVPNQIMSPLVYLIILRCSPRYFKSIIKYDLTDAYSPFNNFCFHKFCMQKNGLFWTDEGDSVLECLECLIVCRS